MKGTPDLFPELVQPAEEKPRTTRASRRARSLPAPLKIPDSYGRDDGVWRAEVALHAMNCPRAQPTRPEWADAQAWCKKMLAAKVAGDHAREKECYANMVRSLMALDHTKVMH